MTFKKTFEWLCVLKGLTLTTYRSVSNKTTIFKRAEAKLML